MSASAYPLHWPKGWPRSKQRRPSRFQRSFVDARTALIRQLELIGAKYPVLSTNVELRLDGLPYAGRKEPNDPGVAVYFERGGRQYVFACDRWDKVKDNINAIANTIESIRGIERWGASDMMERAFSAFEALPAPDWRLDLMFPPGSRPDWEEVEARFRELAKRHHPDVRGDPEKFKAITAAREAARKELAA